MQALRRLTFWGSGAAVALAVAVITGTSNTSARRTPVANSETPRQVTAADLIPRPNDMEAERRRLNEAIRLLTADRDRLLTRMGAIERNLDDVTGSISRRPSPAPSPPAVTASQLPPPASAASAPMQNAAAGGEAAAAPPLPEFTPAPVPVVTSWIPAPVSDWMIRSPGTWPKPPAASRAAAAGDDAQTASIGNRIEFGVDIGGAASPDQLRELWNSAKTRHARLLAGLRPVISLREDKNGGFDLRLVVGPLPNAGAAARLCAALGAENVQCSTGPFEGQRLAVR